MALSYHLATVQWLAADVATTTYTIASIPFQPKAWRVTWVGLGSTTGSDASSTTTDMRAGVGFGTSTTDRRCVISFEDNGAGSSATGVASLADAIAATNTNTSVSGGRLDVSSVTSDSLVFVVDVQVPVDITLTVEIWGGADITVATTLAIAEPASAGDVSYTVTGFVSGATDQVVMFAGCQTTAAAGSGSATDGGVCVGFATSGPNNVVAVGNADQGSGTMDTDHYQQDGECLALVTVGGGGVSARASLSAFGTDEFTLTWHEEATGNRRYIALAIKGGSWHTTSVLIDGDTATSTASVSGLSFAPVGVSAFTVGTTESTADTVAATSRLYIGAGSSTSNRQNQRFESADGTANAEITLSVNYAQLIGDQVDIASFDSGGITLVMDGSSLVPDTWIALLLFGDAPAAGTHQHHKVRVAFLHSKLLGKIV